MHKKKVLSAVFMFLLVVVLIHPEMPEVLAQELARSSSEGITSPSVPPLNQSRHASLTAYGTSFGEGTKSDALGAPSASQGVLKPTDEAAALDNGYGENDQCDCAERFFPRSEFDIPASQ